jgi:hypothetical protein
VVHRIIMHLKIKQMVPTSIPPELIGERSSADFISLNSIISRRLQSRCIPAKFPNSSRGHTLSLAWSIDRVLACLPCSTAPIIEFASCSRQADILSRPRGRNRKVEEALIKFPFWSLLHHGMPWPVTAWHGHSGS